MERVQIHQEPVYEVRLSEEEMHYFINLVRGTTVPIEGRMALLKVIGGDVKDLRDESPA